MSTYCLQIEYNKGYKNKSNQYKKMETKDKTTRMPVLFLGHGNPMNAIAENEFVQGFRDLSETIPTPSAILCVSAHWETRGTYITAVEKPKTIHDFGGFPQELFDVQYPAPGSPELANKTKSLITKNSVALDYNWGLDHGAWTVIKHLYPKANIPIVQLSLDYYQNPQQHYDLAKELKPLRDKGVLIIGSGNIVHNLSLTNWRRLDETIGYDWAIEANEGIKELILKNDYQALINYKNLGKAVQLSIPTPEHFLPLLYALALKEEKEQITILNDKLLAGSLSMTSIKID